MVPRLLTDGQELFEDIHTSIFSITALWQNCTTPLLGISFGYTPYIFLDASQIIENCWQPTRAAVPWNPQSKRAFGRLVGLLAFWPFKKKSPCINILLMQKKDTNTTKRITATTKILHRSLGFQGWALSPLCFGNSYFFYCTPQVGRYRIWLETACSAPSVRQYRRTDLLLGETKVFKGVNKLLILQLPSPLSYVQMCKPQGWKIERKDDEKNLSSLS